MMKQTLTILCCFLFSLPLLAVTGNAWHIPSNTSDLGGTSMRDPFGSYDTNAVVTVYSGTQISGAGNPGNQTGGTLFVREQGGAWNTHALGWDRNTGNNQYWKASFSLNGFTSLDTIEYALLLTYSDKDDTYLGGNDTASTVYETEAAAKSNAFSFVIAGDPVLTVNGVSANYTTSKFFIHEPSGETEDVVVVFEPNDPDLDPATVQLFSNLNRRDRADQDVDGDGVDDGIHPPSGDLISTNDLHYYKAWSMPAEIPGVRYGITLQASKTGAYRLTARYQRTTAPGVWVYYSSNGRRDHAITVSPTDARDIRVYEINTLTVEARDAGGGFIERSTFEDLHDAPTATRTIDGSGFNLDYLNALGVNWLWFQPIHPPGIDGRETDPDTGNPYEPGSPYAVKNFFEVNPWMAASYTGGDPVAARPAAMTAFTNFVAAADAKNVEIMLDAPFNHTSFDCELGDPGVALFQPDGQSWSTTQEWRNTEARFFSRDGDYGQRAFSSASIANAPDRGDFGKWNDTVDVFFGRYAALVDQYPTDGLDYKNEEDWFDYTDPNWISADFVKGGVTQNITRVVWKYFAQYAIHWLDKTGYPGNPTGVAIDTNVGIDGLRCDFGQGLPPQCWEYIINVARDRKWNFVMMSESLDGGEVTYRSNRHFDILNENIVFPLKSASTANDYRNVFDDRRNIYGQGLVLLNNTSHDEENYQDPYEALIRLSVVSAIDGAPMVFFGQELGISQTFGFTHYETNFGKQVAHFKKFNAMSPVRDPGNRTYGMDQLFPVISGIFHARKESPALRSSARYYLDQIGGGTHSKLFAVAKYEEPGVSPAHQDVVLAFANLDRNNSEQGNFNVNIGHGGGNLFGIESNRIYNVRNLAAYEGVTAGRRSLWLWGGGRDGADLMNNGVFVGANPVPATDGDWATVPFEAQYLKLEDVTPPPIPGIPAAPASVLLTNEVTFTWTAPVFGPHDVLDHYEIRIGTTPGGSDLLAPLNVGTNTFYTFLTSYKQSVFASVVTVSAAGISSTSSAQSAGVLLLEPGVDSDGDGALNEDELIAGTSALSSNSVFAVSQLFVPGAAAVQFETQPGRWYRIRFAENFFTDPLMPFWQTIPGSEFLETNLVPVSVTVDDLVPDASRVYRVEVSVDPF